MLEEREREYGAVIGRERQAAAAEILTIGAHTKRDLH